MEQKQDKKRKKLIQDIFGTLGVQLQNVRNVDQFTLENRTLNPNNNYESKTELKA